MKKTVKIKGFARVGTHHKPYAKCISHCPKCQSEIADNQGILEIFETRTDANRGSGAVNECTITIEYEDI
jgi:hypothetical protein